MGGTANESPKEAQAQAQAQTEAVEVASASLDLDGQTDGRTDRRTDRPVAKLRSSLARKFAWAANACVRQDHLSFSRAPVYDCFPLFFLSFCAPFV